VLNDELLTRCEQIMRTVCDDLSADLAEFSGETDHVHLLVHYPPHLAISTLVNRLKGVSVRYLRDGFTGRTNRHRMHGHLWSPAHFAASCGGAPLCPCRSSANTSRTSSARPDGRANHRDGLTRP
jgi:putative transposase